MRDEEYATSKERLQAIDKDYREQLKNEKKSISTTYMVLWIINTLMVLVISLVFITGIRNKITISLLIFAILGSLVYSSKRLLDKLYEKMDELYSKWAYDREEGRLTGIAADFVNNHRIDITDTSTYGADTRSDKFLEEYNSALANYKETDIEKFHQMLSGVIDVTGHISTGKVLTDHYFSSVLSSYLNASYFGEETTVNAIPKSKIKPAGKGKLKYTLKHDAAMNPVYDDYPGTSYDIIHIISVELDGKELNDEQLGKLFKERR